MMMMMMIIIIVIIIITCNEATQSGPLTHSQSHQAQNAAEHTEVKQRRAWTKEEILVREVVWYYMYCRQTFTENYKKMYEIWRQRNPETRMYGGCSESNAPHFFFSFQDTDSDMKIERQQH